MSIITKIQNWGDEHHPKSLDYLRIVLGIILIWKGIAFALNLHAFTLLMENARLGTSVTISFMAHLIIALHIIGGLLIALGSNTRVFCLLNLPILIVAVFFVNLSPNIFRPYSEIWLSSLVFVGLLLFLVMGDGRLSIEYEKKDLAA
ncbi:DoxX family protein [Pedobacter duraquae]|uniref:Putative membrane protein YphA (DoxX/SURF4 family) n=1 Tax=Pedobacter duraquae TaxID=425511 RepID=A0A4V3C3K6_9SPHI|nr:DoxX family protein [Pedobacter duraquae]TDO22448.1 putative membrane protein YphA (DoxX/SURF4 family) [Pedobacter duraquae]